MDAADSNEPQPFRREYRRPPSRIDPDPADTDRRMTGAAAVPSQQAHIVTIQQTEEFVVAEVVTQRTVQGGREAGRRTVEEGNELLSGIVP